MLTIIYNILYLIIYNILYACTREMYEAARWHDDARFQSPMIIHMGAHIFIGDIVQFIDPKEEISCYGKILNYMTEVPALQILVHV